MEQRLAMMSGMCITMASLVLGFKVAIWMGLTLANLLQAPATLSNLSSQVKELMLISK